MSNTQSSSQHNGSNASRLFDLLYYFPTNEEDLKDLKKIDMEIRQIIFIIKKMQKHNVDEIEKVCNLNKKLQIIVRYLFNENLSILVVNLFTHLMVSNKLLNFIVKLSVPLIIYRNIIKTIEKDGPTQRKKLINILKNKQIEESFKFILEYCRYDSKKLPRFYANLISKILAEYTSNKNVMVPVFQMVLQMSIQVFKSNLTLAAESQILLNLFNKVISGEIDVDKTKIIMEIIVNYCNSKQTREIIHGCIDLGKAFARFNNVDLRNIKNEPNNFVRSKQSDEYEEKLIKSCLIIETLLSSWSTLIYFIIEKTTLMNFINGLVRKSPLEIQIIKKHVLKQIIIRTLSYNKNRMLKSLNQFGYKSNYLNYRGLVLINFLLKNDALYETFESISNEGQLLQSLSSLCLQYFPHISQNQKYSKKIIKNIKYPRHYETFIAKQAYKKKLESYNEQILISLKSYCKPSLISYYFEPKQIRNYLIWFKQDRRTLESFSEELQTQIQNHLNQTKILCQETQIPQKSKVMDLLTNFYKVGIQVSYHIPWKGQNLKFAKFLSSILQYLINNEHTAIFSLLIRIMRTIFQRPKFKYCRYLICSVLDDLGKYIPTNEEFQTLILNNCLNDDYAFIISKILINIDYEKSTDRLNKTIEKTDAVNPKKILELICLKEGSDYIILEIIEIIKKIYYENVEKNQQESSCNLMELISNVLIYHKNQEIVRSCLQFFEEIVMSKTGCIERYVKLIKLDKIKTDFHRKKASFLFLAYEGGFESVFQLYPQFFKEELQNWTSKSPVVLKQYTNFILKQVKRFNNVYTKQKQSSNYLFLGFQQEERHQLLNLPWNIMINDECYPALAQYKVLKEKLKLRVRVSRVIQSQITISLLNIGMNCFGKQLKENEQNNPEALITIRQQEVAKSYEKNKNKEGRQQLTKFAVTKQQVSLFFTVDYNQNFILEKLNINIHLQKKIYRPLLCPHNFIYLLTLTKSGMEFLRKQKVFEKINEKIATSEKCFQTLKQNLVFLAGYCSGYRQLKDSMDKKQYYDGLMKGFWKVFVQTTNYEIKQICHWIMNVLIKDEEFQLRIKSEKDKKGKFVETKYGGTLFYFNYIYQQHSLYQDQFDNLSFIKEEMPQKLQHQPQFKQIHDFLNNEQKQRELLNIKTLNTLKQNEFSNPKVFENIMKYMSLINYNTFKIHIVFEMYKKYLASSKFQTDFPNGFMLP